MAVDVYAALKQLIESILGDRDQAAQFAGDPQGTLAAQGITDGDLSQVDVRQLVGECASGADLPDGPRQLLQSYSSGGGAPASYPVKPPPAGGGAQSPEQVVQHLNYVTYATYEGDEYVTQQLINYEEYDYSTNIDNSVDVDVDGDVHGDIDLETTNVNATGDGAVAAGEDVENAVTGDDSVLVDGDNSGLINTGDGAVQADGDIDAPVNTGEFTGIQNDDGTVENAVVGDDNQVAQVDGSADDSVFNFGDGDVTNFGDAHIEDAAVAVGGGDANNVSDNTLYDGAAASAGGDAAGNVEEDYQETYVDAYDSIVTTEQGPGDLGQENVDLAQNTEQEPDVPIVS